MKKEEVQTLTELVKSLMRELESTREENERLAEAVKFQKEYIGAVKDSLEGPADEMLIPHNVPFSMSIMIKSTGLAIGLRYGSGSENHPNFGIVPTPKSSGGIQPMGGGDGAEPSC